MPSKPILIINAQDCPPEKENEFNDYYNRHASALFKFKGVKNITRYKRIDKEGNAPRYFALYYFDSQKDYEQYMASPEREAGMKVTGRPEGVKVQFRAQYELIKEWER